MTDVVLSIVALGLAALRVAGYKQPAFQAAAHLFTGGLFGAYLADRSRGRWLAIAVALSLVELACFVVGRLSR